MSVLYSWQGDISVMNVMNLSGLLVLVSLGLLGSNPMNTWYFILDRWLNEQESSLFGVLRTRV